MSNNSIAIKYDDVVTSLEDGADGADAHGVAVGLLQNTGVVLRTVLEKLVGKAAGPLNVPPAVEGLKTKWNNAKTGKVLGTAIANSAKSAGRALASACIGVLKPRLGNQWNNDWQAAGFTNHSLAIPTNPLPLLQQLRAYFTTNPGYEVPDLTPTISATAAACEAAAQAISDGDTTSNQSNTDAGNAKKALDEGIGEARMRLGGLRDELGQFLDPDDELWYAFGFNKPSDPETPEVSVNVTLTPGAVNSRMSFIDWDNARRGASYRVTVAETANLLNVLANEIVTESDFTYTGAVGGPGAVTVTVVSRNSKGGESAASVPVAGTLP